MSYPSIIKEAALEKLFHTDLSFATLQMNWVFHVPRYMGGRSKSLHSL
jgi:hypothetical protein